MSARGFTLVELLIASTLTVLVLASALTMAAAARRALDVEPAALDTVRRMREGVAALSGVLAGAGAGPGIGDPSLALGSSVPLVRPLTSLTGAAGPVFTALWVLRGTAGGAGRVAQPQPGPGGSLTLDRAGSGCARTPVVCGFDVEDVAVIFDSRGHSDVFEIAAVSEGLGRIPPRQPLAYTYTTGASVMAARADRFGLMPQADGSQALTRITFAGAREPMVDGVVELVFQTWGRAAAPDVRDAVSGPGLAQYGLHPLPPLDADPDGVFPDGVHCMTARTGAAPVSRLASHPPGADGLTQFAPEDFSDGPWCAFDGAPGAYDADLFRLQRVDIRLRVEVQSAEFRGPAGRLFTRGGTATRNTPRWVLDRAVVASVALGR
jgi:hypothetical protein